MNMKAAANLMVTGCVVLAASEVPAADKFQKLGSTQIRAKLAGMEMTDEVHWRDYYERDGSFKSRGMGRIRVGRWSVQDDELCVDLGTGTDSGCYEVWLSGNKVELRPTGLGLSLKGVLQQPTDGTESKAPRR
jgi:hypothetical protein